LGLGAQADADLGQISVWELRAPNGREGLKSTRSVPHPSVAALLVTVSCLVLLFSSYKLEERIPVHV